MDGKRLRRMVRHGGYALSAVNEYQGLCPEKITRVTNPYLNTLGLQTRGDEIKVAD
jgi:hypothetical protein